MILEMGSLSLEDIEEGIEYMRELGQKTNKSESSYDFLLTAHGGLKGTSKPVYYRVRR